MFPDILIPFKMLEVGSYQNGFLKWWKELYRNSMVYGIDNKVVPITEEEYKDIKVENIDLDRQEVMIPHLKRGIKKTCPKCGRTGGRSQKFCSRCGTDLSKIVAEGIEERQRLVNIGDETTELLREYIKGLNPKERLIDISRQQVYNIVREAAEAIGLKGKTILNPETGKKHYPHPHNFRDSLAVSWLTYASGDITKQKALQEHLGHQNFDTTMRYFKLQPSQIKKVSDEVRKARFDES